MRIARRLLERRARSYYQLRFMPLGVLSPFALMKGNHMPKPTLALAPTVEVQPKLVTSTKLDTLLGEYMTTVAKLDQLTAKKKALATSLASDWHKRHGPKIETGEYLSTKVPSHSSNISRELLLKLGVKATIIAKATKKTPYTYVKVTRKKETTAP